MNKPVQDIILPLYSFKQWSEVHTLINYIIFNRNLSLLNGDQLSSDLYHADYPLFINCNETHNFIVHSKTMSKFVCEKIELLFEQVQKQTNFLGMETQTTTTLEKWIIPVYYIRQSRQSNQSNISENRLGFIMQYIQENITPIIQRLGDTFVIDNPKKNLHIKQKIQWMKEPGTMKQMIKSMQSLAQDTLFSFSGPRSF